MHALELTPAARHACEEAVRSRLKDLERGQTEPARLRAKRMSLDLLHQALEECELTTGQARLLDQLLRERAAALDARPLPFWTGARYLQIVTTLEELQEIAHTREKLAAVVAAG